ncbi:MAG: hypothetical protein ACM3PE_00590 [Deltaproteobacteria bacterium]
MLDEPRPGFAGEEESEIVKYSKKPLYHRELSNTLEQLDFQIHLLSGLLYRLAQQGEVLEHAGIHILCSLNEVSDYIYQKDGDYILLTSPEYIPVVFKNQDIGWVKDPHEFANWLMVNWTEESLVIAILST